jgi:phage shock protein PspC (stress-responsive transcriptional regulator)
MTNTPHPPASYQPLRRSQTDKMIAGICGGFARYLGIDPVAARVIYVLGTILTGGALIVAYLAIWVLMPLEDAWPTPPNSPYPPATPPAAQFPPAA